MSKDDKPCQKNFKSPSTGQLCTGAQYIAELICIRFSEKQNIGTLAYKFWNKTQKKSYQAQIVCANRIIAKYSEQALINTLIKNPRIFSLGFYHPHKWVLELVEKEYNDLEAKRVAKEESLRDVKEEKRARVVSTTPMKRAPKKNMFSQINKIEGNKNGEG